jgi:hypothetical protein
MNGIITRKDLELIQKLKITRGLISLLLNLVQLLRLLQGLHRHSLETVLEGFLSQVETDTLFLHQIHLGSMVIMLLDTDLRPQDIHPREHILLVNRQIHQHIIIPPMVEAILPLPILHRVMKLVITRLLPLSPLLSIDQITLRLLLIQMYTDLPLSITSRLKNLRRLHLQMLHLRKINQQVRRMEMENNLKKVLMSNSRRKSQ